MRGGVNYLRHESQAERQLGIEHENQKSGQKHFFLSMLSILYMPKKILTDWHGDIIKECWNTDAKNVYTYDERLK